MEREDLVAIFEGMARNGHYTVDADAAAEAHFHIGRISAARTDKFGNAREIRNFFERVLEQQANRLAPVVSPSLEQLSSIDFMDIMRAGGLFDDTTANGLVIQNR